ncbi:nitrilase-related carbon-nitrogen hydrolase [Arthrobacter sp. NPDC055138]
MKVGLTQWNATTDVDANLSVAVDLIGKAAAEEAELVVLPENGLMLGTNVQMRERVLSEAAPEVEAVRAAAAEYGTTVILGGMKNATPGGVVNSALVIDPKGQLTGRYDKIHLFDARVNGQSFEASSVERPGTEPVLLDLNGTLIGLTICYDVRFPELHRRLALAGAQILLVPSAFTQSTGEAHWETLLRARAIENGCFVVAPATVRSPQGPGYDAFETYGHAMIVSPWGEVMTDLGVETPAVQVLTLDVGEVNRARASLPVLQGTKPEAYSADPRVLEIRTEGENP